LIEEIQTGKLAGTNHLRNTTTTRLTTRITKIEQAAGAWRKSVGMFDGDQIMKQIIDRGAAIRRAEGRKARRA